MPRATKRRGRVRYSHASVLEAHSLPISADTDNGTMLRTMPIIWETGNMSHDSGMDPRQFARGKTTQDLAECLETYIERRASGRIRDLHVVCSDEGIILQGRSRTYHAKQLAQQAVLDVTDGEPVLTNQIEVC